MAPSSNEIPADRPKEGWQKMMALTMYINLFLKISTDFGNDLTRILRSSSKNQIFTNKTFLKIEFFCWIAYNFRATTTICLNFFG